MKNFGEFNIKPKTKGFVGDNIKIGNVLNLNIIVEDFKKGPSKIEGKGLRLDMQIILNNTQRVVWVSSNSLIEMIESVPKEDFPFKAKIIKESSGRLVFTSADE